MVNADDAVERRVEDEALEDLALTQFLLGMPVASVVDGHSQDAVRLAGTVEVGLTALRTQTADPSERK